MKKLLSISSLLYSILVSNVYADQDIEINSNIENIVVSKTNSVPLGPYSTAEEGYEDQCERVTVQPKLKTAQMIFDKGWKITSEIVYGPYEFVSFAGNFDYMHNYCFAIQTNIGIFYKENLLAIISTSENNSYDLAYLELLESSEIEINAPFIYTKATTATFSFKKNEILIDHPNTFSMACKTKGIIPDIKNLNI